MMGPFVVELPSSDPVPLAVSIAFSFFFLFAAVTRCLQSKLDWVHENGLQHVQVCGPQRGSHVMTQKKREKKQQKGKGSCLG